MATGESDLHAARHEFAGALQSALTLDEVSTAFMSTARRVLPADCVGMYRLGADSQSVLDVRSDAWGQFLDDYERFGRDDDPVLEFVLRERRPIDSSRAASPEIWESSGARVALREVGLEHSMEAPLVASGRFIGIVNFARVASAPPFSSSDLMSARLIGEQLSLAIERALRFETSGARSTVMESALDRFPMAVIVTNLDARVVFQNRSARNANLVPSGELTGRTGHESVEACILEALHDFRTKGKRLHVRSIKERGSGAQHIVKTHRLGTAQAAVVTLVYSGDPPTADRQLPSWGVLSRREQEIAQLVSEGLTTKQIADRAFISENTVKQHLKRVFTKTDVRNRAELVQLIWSAGRRPDDHSPS